MSQQQSSQKPQKPASDNSACVIKVESCPKVMKFFAAFKECHAMAQEIEVKKFALPFTIPKILLNILKITLRYLSIFFFKGNEQDKNWRTHEAAVYPSKAKWTPKGEKLHTKRAVQAPTLRVSKLLK